ncbi:dual specificity protein phosphatase 3-like isoform X4 [Mizuhopecten yessoensis]|uniref:dual specificity protein phosphatase 3-like isoform X4 n=1 Tax=Mizuhopecten yessoensis TaxID=6573 RepID=UPI000B45CE6B|nr:dual specificity protein phosphatase 3-like isoform X4 [Mizuhopecten yessoensis]XP_021373980.1 dual specificity protein phosphatase 3-like isoform X4 [Mizuhopecten yessoensis]
MSYSQVTFSRVREYLMNANDSSPGTKTPMGAQPTVMMFQFPVAPRENYNEVYPGIIIGDKVCSKDKGQLKALGVTHVVNCCQGIKLNQVDSDAAYFRDAGIDFHGIKALDHSSYNMTPHFSAAAKFIEKALKSNGKIYVHCSMGISRSATVVLAFLLLKQNLGLMEAVKTIRAKREVFPNEGFIRQLCILESTLHTSL